MRVQAHERGTRVSRCAAIGLGILAFASPSALAQARRELWSIDLTVRATLTNDLFVSPLSAGGTRITSPTLAFRYARVRTRSSYGALVWAGPNLFRDAKVFDGMRYGFGASGQHRLSRRGQLRFGAAYSDGLDVETLFASHLTPPQLVVRAFSADVGYSHELSRSTTVGLSTSGFATRYRAGVSFDTATLPGETRTPPDVLEPLGREPLVPGAPEAPDTTAQVIGVLGVEGLQGPGLDYWSWRTGADLALRFSPRSSLTGTVGYRRTWSGEAFYDGGEQLDATLAWRRGLGPTTGLAVSFTEDQSLSPASYRSHSLRVGADKVLNRRYRFDASLGAAYRDSRDGSGSGWDLLGGAGFSARFRRTSLAARYDRANHLGVITGRNYTTDSAFASLSHSITRRLFATAYGYYLSARDSLGELSTYRSTLIGTSLATRIKRSGRAGVSYSYQRFARGALPTRDRWVLSAFVSYRLSGK